MAKRRKKASPLQSHKDLSEKEKRYLAARMAGLPSGQAAVEAGYSPKNPHQSASQAKKHIDRKMPELMDRLGLTDAILIKKYLQPLLKAKETKFFQHQGKVVSTRKVEALGIRREALNMAFLLKGSYAAKTEEEANLKNQFPSIIILDSPRPIRPILEAVTVEKEK